MCRESRYGFTRGQAVRLAHPDSEEKGQLVGRVEGFATTAFWGVPCVLVSWFGQFKPVPYGPSELEHFDAVFPA
ncbi:hypothetical protein [Streptomyces sp. NPDC049555]|uniref:hypothetical protein n=1 Tax=Streptomyces sp. NPDC049555 TaxID=3154930 RepID=UPI0034192A56